MQNHIKSLEKASLFLRNNVICLKNWKLWRALTSVELNFFAEILHTSHTYQCLQKGVHDFLDFEFFVKIKKIPGFYTLTETRFFTVSWGAKFQQKLLNFMLVGARQIFQ